MFTLVAATLFFAAFAFAIGTMGWMFLAYRDKIIAALAFEPIPQKPVVYHVRIRRPRSDRAPRGASRSFAANALAA